MKKFLFMTVGTGENIESGMLVSIKSHHPDKVIFLASKEAIEKKKPLLEPELEKMGYDNEWKEISSHEDLEKCLEEFRNILKNFDLKNCSPVFDITFGTKPMTAALTVIAGKIGDSISYVTGGRRDEHGKVIKGTERFISFETRRFRARSAVEEAVSLFNKYFYSSAKEILLIHRELLSENLEERRFIETLLLLTDFQLAREDFLFEEASEKLKTLKTQFPEEFAIFLGFQRESLEKLSEQFIEQFSDIAQNPFSHYRLGELIDSASRAAAIGRYNDATARLYRALEFMGQLKLKEFDMIDDEFIPFGRASDGKCEKIEDYKTRPAGLTEIYKCLYYLGLKSASKVIDPQTNQPHPALSHRNKSILAHGFKPVTKYDYEEMKKLVDEIATDFAFSTHPVVKDLKLKNPF